MSKILRVLVVDDQQDIYEYLTDFLPLVGSYAVEHAPTLIHALAKTNAYEPEVIVFNTDIPPQQHTRQILKEIMNKHKNCRVLAVATDDAETKRVLKKQGVHGILVRPFDMTDLSQRVKEMLPLLNVEKPESCHARLLIADDEPDLAYFIGEYFHELGLQVYTARDGEEAFEVFTREKCNLAIVDLNMPKISGRKLIDMMRASAAPPRDIIVIGAALGDSAYEIRRMGCDLHEKPLDLEALKQIILEDCRKFRLTLASHVA